jgi:uncharacterized protein (DUF2141 family)
VHLTPHRERNRLPDRTSRGARVIAMDLQRILRSIRPSARAFQHHVARCKVLPAVLLVTFLYTSFRSETVAPAQCACEGIHIKILDIRNSTGSVACALFESAQGFPIEFLQNATNVMVIKIRDTQARCDFEDIPAGTYAIAVIHDENVNGKLDTNRIGIPTEGYGFSNGARATLGPPSFSAASFPYDGATLSLSIRLRY